MVTTSVTVVENKVRQKYVHECTLGAVVSWNNHPAFIACAGSGLVAVLLDTGQTVSSYALVTPYPVGTSVTLRVNPDE